MLSRFATEVSHTPVPHGGTFLQLHFHRYHQWGIIVGTKDAGLLFKTALLPSAVPAT